MKKALSLILLAVLATVVSSFKPQQAVAITRVTPTVETPEVLDEIVSPPGDADDPAIWLHPEDPSLSLVLGTVKDAGLRVYDLNGTVIQSISPDSIRYNNVDLIYNFNLNNNVVDLAIASDRRNDQGKRILLTELLPEGIFNFNFTAIANVSDVKFLLHVFNFSKSLKGRYLISQTGIN